ncbi:hypothetical protein PQR52_24995 [Paraburkholderia aspalathi]|uniref:hypothetical protein n=1 Tax=Paraburkholderia aspalathi TaxID=1324617 RepID=UPI0038B7A8D3
MTQLARAAWPWIAAALYCGVLNANAAELPASLQKSLAPYSISEVLIEGGVLKVTMKRSTVTRTMFYSIVSRGACSPLWDNGKAWGAAKINRIEVRNAIGAQGFAFQGGRKECHELGNISEGDSASKQYVDARTWVCVAGMDCRPRRAGEVIAGDE